MMKRMTMAVGVILVLGLATYVQAVSTNYVQRGTSGALGIQIGQKANCTTTSTTDSGPIEVLTVITNVAGAVLKMQTDTVDPWDSVVVTANVPGGTLDARRIICKVALEECADCSYRASLSGTNFSGVDYVNSDVLPDANGNFTVVD